MSRMSRQDWSDLGLRLLAEHGPEALTVAEICRAAGKTRGSLYHHFPDVQALHEGVMERWFSRHTRSVIAQVDEGPPGERAERMHELTTSLDPVLERNVRRLVARNPSLRPHLTRADAARVGWLTDAYAQLVPATEAGDLARIEYAAWVGFQHMEPRPGDQELLDLYQRFQAVLAAYLEA